MMPSASPNSQCGLGVKSNARGSPQLRTTTLSSLPAPDGTAASSTLGTSPEIAAVSAFFSALSASTAPRARRQAASKSVTRSMKAGSWPRRRTESRTRSGSRRIKAMSSIVAKRRVMRSTQSLLPGATFETDRLLAPQQAIIAYAAAVAFGPVGTESVGLADAFGRVLAVDAVCGDNVPAQPRSTMDGFAVRSADGTQPRRIAGAVRMGAAPPAPLGAGEAMQIPTGGTLPDG